MGAVRHDSINRNNGGDLLDSSVRWIYQDSSYGEGGVRHGGITRKNGDLLDSRSDDISELETFLTVGQMIYQNLSYGEGGVYGTTASIGRTEISLTVGQMDIPESTLSVSPYPVFRRSRSIQTGSVPGPWTWDLLSAAFRSPIADLPPLPLLGAMDTHNRRLGFPLLYCDIQVGAQRWGALHCGRRKDADPPK